MIPGARVLPEEPAFEFIIQFPVVFGGIRLIYPEEN
jgi:hypothetical protein